MSIERTIVAATVVAVGIAVVGVVSVLVHGTVVEARERRQLVRRRAAANALARVAAGLDSSADAAELLHGLRPADVVVVAGQVSSLVDTGSSEVMEDVARAAGLDERGRRLIRSWFWWRRLQGVQLASILQLEHDEVLDLAADRNAEVRALTTDVLARHGGRRSVELLVALLADDNGLCQFAAANALARLGSAAVRPIARHLLQPEPAGLERTLAVAGAIQDPALTPVVARFVDHPDSAVRIAAVRALCALGDRSGIDTGARCLGDSCAAVRRAAAVALGGTRHWRLSSAIAVRLDDPDVDVARAAGEALTRIGATGTLLLQRRARENDTVAALCRHLLDVAAVHADREVDAADRERSVDVAGNRVGKPVPV